jgi:hypothetical protein
MLKTAMQLGIKDDIVVYLARSGLNDEKHVLRAMRLRRRFVTTALAKWTLIAGLFAAFVQLKNKNRFNS